MSKSKFNLEAYRKSIQSMDKFEARLQYRNLLFALEGDLEHPRMSKEEIAENIKLLDKRIRHLVLRDWV